MGHVDFSPASFYRALNYNQYPLEIKGIIYLVDVNII